MFGILKTRLIYIRSQYAPGTRVELAEMNDQQAPPSGTKGTVMFVDDIGTIHVHWGTGDSLGVVHGKDKCLVIEK